MKLLLTCFVSDMVIQPAAMRIGTHRFTAVISPQCSGLEGVGLLVIFGALWLWLFRKEIRFPQSLLLLPAGVVLYVLNAVRITLLILIGHAGAREVAAGGFHSQAGWIAFSCVAFGLSVAARRLPWFWLRSPEEPALQRPIDQDGTAAYLVPFLAILAAGMLSRAASGHFEWFYSIRLFMALGALY
ncbi:MAG: archaeosortase/exosortase family protein [Acidobacteriota bacterium]|nr:archaeosortase/exosortase family protein [Acidobacteriota bacterium]